MGQWLDEWMDGEMRDWTEGLISRLVVRWVSG